MTYDVDTQLYLDGIIEALDGVYADENIPVLEGPAERVLDMYGENKPTFISVSDETMTFTPTDGYQLMENVGEYRVEIFVMAAPEEQTDRPVRRARAISDYIIGYFMARNLSVTKPDGTVRSFELRPVSRERVLEESVLSGHFAITVELIAHEVLQCQ